MASRHEKMYADTPKMERGDDGKVAVKRPSRGGAEKKAEGHPGLRHMHERREMMHRHVHERMGMHHRHEMEHAAHKGKTEPLHDRHEREVKDMHNRHESEQKAMHDRQEKEAPDGGMPGVEDAGATEGAMNTGTAAAPANAEGGE